MRSLVTSLFASLALGVWALSVGAQQIDQLIVDSPDAQIAPTILTVDIDRLFGQSLFGERIVLGYNDGRGELAVENRRIADGLREEELELAALRAEMDPSVFRTEAEAFDAKAQAIRRAQDAKESALENSLAEGRTQFLEVSRPILGQLMLDRGAFAILDRRSVLLSAGSIDVTDDAIRRIDEALGDGANADPPPPQD